MRVLRYARTSVKDLGNNQIRKFIKVRFVKVR